MNRLSTSSHEPHDRMTRLAYKAAAVLPDDMLVIVLVSDPATDGNGIAVTGYKTNKTTDDEARRDVTAQAMVDMLIHLRAMAQSVGLKLDVADPRDLN